jgi:quinohemoprotein ethanol dehydrogenase
MTFMIDGKQYIAVAGGPPGPGMGFGSEPTAAPGPQQPSRLLVYALDGKAKLPAAPPAPAAPASGAPAN